jgi:hypothetical protein
LSDFEGEDVRRVGQLEQQAEVGQQDELSVCFAVEEVGGAGHSAEGFAVLQVHGAGEQRLQAGRLVRGARLRRGAGLDEQTVEQRACVAEKQRVERVEQREEVVVAA